MNENKTKKKNTEQISNGWIPVVERLPEVGKKVLLCYFFKGESDHPDTRRVETGMIWPTNFPLSECWIIGNMVYYDERFPVTHW